MAFLKSRLLEVLQMGETIAGIFDLPEKSLPKPGQYLPSQHLKGERNILYHPLFTVIGPPGHTCLGPIPARWQPGDQIVCSPPQGNGFKLPGSARRVGLLALNSQPIRTLPLIHQALGQNASVVLFFKVRPQPDILEWIPSSVEVSPLNELQENLDWLEFLAVEMDREDMEEFKSFLNNESYGFAGQVLVNTAMTCHGLGECSVCAVKTRHGWRHTCTDGPVFPLKELLHVAE